MKHPESEIQQNAVEWFKLQYPKKLIAASQNGARVNIRQAVTLKKEGLLRGLPDLFIPEPTDKYHGLWIEMKSPKGRTTKHQDDIILKMIERGYMVSICRSLGEFQEVVRYYFKPLSRR